MRKAGRYLSAGLFLLLVLLCSHLVEGPAPSAPSEEAPPPLHAALRQMEALAGEQAHPAAARTAPQRRFFRPVQQDVPRAGCARVTDKNGHPLAGRTYVRTVYTVCPLEDMPG